MTGLKHLAILLSLVLFCTSCVTTSPDDASDDQPTENVAALDNNPPSADASLEGDLDQPAKENEAAPKDEFAQFDDNNKGADTAPPPPEVAQQEAPPPPAQDAPPPEIPKQETPPPPEVAAQPPQPEVPPEPAPEPPAEAQGSPVSGLVTIKSIQFKANDNGGTVVIEADGPMTYSTRMSASSGQFVIDIPNSLLPKKLTHPLVTKDFEGMIGSIEAYQGKGSNVSRVVVHMQEGAAEPVVQSEGSSLLVVASSPTSAPKDSEVHLLSYGSLEEFMAGNMNFSGKKISIESESMDVGDLFRLISDEVGVNLVIADDVKGSMNVKLRQVPWDQAIVMIMKAKKLSFTRSGNVLRIAPMDQLRAEEDQAIKMATAKRDVAPLTVKIIPISYSKISDLVEQIKPFLTEKRGRVIGDPRTSSVVVSDTDETVARIVKLIQSIDIPPQQVLIEGKVVEAQESFSRQVGVQWSANNIASNLGQSSIAPINMNSGINITPGAVTTPSGSLNFSLGTLDILGNLTATLNLQESEGLLKVLSSPRIVTLHNEEASISQTQEIPLITSTGTQGVVQKNVQFKPVRLNLKVTPNITNDGAVIMKVDVTREFVGPVADTDTQARPVNGRTAVTKVMVRNGQTAVIGGIYQDDTTTGETKVPWLGNIPVLGWLFKSQTKDDLKNELLIFLTPRILGQLDSQAIPESSQENPIN
jgi:type IV pilus assembly protein PilQ